MLRLSNIRIGIKLATMSGIAIVLVVGMATIQHLNGVSISNQNFEQDAAQSVRSKLKDSQAAILRTWVAGRDGLLAETSAAVDKAIDAMHSNATFANDRLDSAGKSLSNPDDLDRVKKIKSAFADYTASSEVQLKAQKDLLDLRQRQLDTTAAWNKAYGAVTASSDFANPDSFASGVKIGTSQFALQDVLVQLSPNAGLATLEGQVNQVGAHPFRFGGRTIQFGRAGLKTQLTASGLGAATSLTPPVVRLSLSGTQVVAS